MVDELRRAFHDRIADVRALTTGILHAAAASLDSVTEALLTSDPSATTGTPEALAHAEGLVATVESEVVDLLAQQAPVARDLRLILASLRVSQIADLCLGLVTTLVARVGRVDHVAMMRDMGEDTVRVLHLADRAWAALDVPTARAVESAAETCHAHGRAFLAAVIGLGDLPVDHAVDLGMLARGYERLTDHAVEVAERVVSVSPPNGSAEQAGSRQGE